MRSDKDQAADQRGATRILMQDAVSANRPLLSPADLVQYSTMHKIPALVAWHDSSSSC